MTASPGSDNGIRTPSSAAGWKTICSLAAGAAAELLSSSGGQVA